MKRSLLFFFLPMISLAQQAVIPSGGTGSGSGGTNTFSIGQVVYTEISGTGGAAIQGVQQPFEIFVLDDGGHHDIKLEALVYPNPTESDLILRIVTATPQVFNYEFFDMHGRLLLKDRTNGIETHILIDRFPVGTYILKVHSGRNILKNFKIIKNTP